MTGSPGTRPAPDLPPGPRAALVVATASYQDPELSQLRATADDAQLLTEVLGDPRIGGFAVTSIVDADERRVRRAIDVFLSGCSRGDLVLIYLSCHGVLDRRNRLYLAAADTVKDQLGSTGIPAAWLVEQLEECRARQQVVILDCCFSGAFAIGSKGDGELDLERRLAGNARGRAVLTASRSGEYSFTGDALSGAAVSGSVFTAGLVEGLRTGAADAGGDGYVSVDEAYDFAYRHVLSLGAGQTPQRWLSGGEGAIVLARSVAGIAITAAALPGELADALESRYPAIRIGAVHELGSWLAGEDPGLALTARQKLSQIADNDNHTVAAAARAYLSARRIQDRAARLLADAERAAQSITYEGDKVRALCELAQALAATNPDHAARLLADAERVAQSTTGGWGRVFALTPVAKAVAATNPERATRLLADAERAAHSVVAGTMRSWALSTVAQALLAINPDHAERIAQSLTDPKVKAEALSVVAQALTATNPDHAARLLADAERDAQSVTHDGDKLRVLCEVAQALTATNPDRATQLLADAERIAQSLTDEPAKAPALRGVAQALAPINPDHAERIAQSLTDETAKALALNAVAKAVAASDPDRATRLLADAERATQSITEKWGKGWALREVAQALAASDPDRATRLLADAERVVKSITEEELRLAEENKARALSEIVQVLASINPDHAELIAQSITIEKYKASALITLATV